MNKVKIILIALMISLLLIISVVIILNSQNGREYELEKIEKYSYFKLYQNQKYGVIDDKGNTIIEPSYEMVNIPNPSKPLFVCYYEYNEEESVYKAKILNDKGEEILTEYEEVLPLLCEESVSNIPFEKSVLQYKEKDKYGIINFEGKKITNAIYDEIKSLEYKEGSLKVKKDDKYGIINIKGKTVIKAKYEDIIADEFFTSKDGYMNSGYIVKVKTDQGYRYGYFDKNGKEVIKPTYNELSRMTEIDNNNVYLIVSKNGKLGVLENTKLLIETKYDDIEFDRNNNLFVVEKDSKYGVLSLNGKTILPVEYDGISLSKSRITTTKGESIDLFNTKGEKLDTKYDNTIETSNSDYLIVVDDNKYGVISSKGQTLIDTGYENIEYAFGTYFIATIKGKVGVLDINNGKVIDFEYDIIQKVKEKNILEAIYSKTNTIEIYNSRAEKQLSIKDAVIRTSEDYIKVLSNDNMIYLNNNGNIISNKEALKDRQAFASNSDGKWGFVNDNDVPVITAKYDMVTEFNEYGFAGIKQNDKWGVIDITGKVILEPTYEFKWNEPDFIGKYYKTNIGYGFEYYTDEV